MSTASHAASSARVIASRAFWVLLCGLLPLVALYYTLGPVAFGDARPADFHFAYYPAAEAIVAGEAFYPIKGFMLGGAQEFVINYVYPPLTAVATIPLTVLPAGHADVLFQLLLVAAFIGTLAVIGVRDWRCYGLAFLWPPVTDAIATGNVSILLGFTAGLAWRFRDQPVRAGASVGISVATKIFLWPLVIWLAATRRVAGAFWSASTGLALLLLTWGAVRFHGLAEYPGLVRRLSERADEQGYTVYALGVDVGMSAGLARALWIALAVAILAVALVLGRRGDDRRSYVLALTAAIAFSPIVWLHYFALLLVIVAVVQPRLGPMWFVGLPLQVFVTTGVYNGSTLQTIAVLAAAAVTVALALRPAVVEKRADDRQLAGRTTTVISSPR